jgi:hypothetical protein
MGTYVDAEDLRQHFRAGGGLDDELVEEVMLEQENYVQQRLGLSALPPENPILKNIVRDLTIAGAIYVMTPASADNVVKADSQRREALRRLEELRVEGFRVGGDSNICKSIEAEMYNSYEDSYFKANDFGL